MGYTNGFNIAQVLEAMQKRLGWRQSQMTGSPTLSADNVLSNSGRFFQDFHPLVTIANIKAVIEEPNISDEFLNEYLVNLQDAAIMRCLNEVFRETELIEQKLLYTRAGANDQAVDNSNLFVGYEINVANDFALSTQISLATLYFNEDVTFNLYLFMDGRLSPIKTIPVTVSAFERTEIDIEEIVLNFKIGGKYYFGYFQSELGTAKAIQEQVRTYASMKCFSAVPFAAEQTASEDFNHNGKQYTSVPYGLNLEMISFRDHTQKILRKANLFDEAIGLTVALMVLEQITMSTRTNKDERLAQEQAEKLYMDINQAYPTNEVPVTPGLKSRIAREYEKLKKTFFPTQQAISTPIQQCDEYSKR